MTKTFILYTLFRQEFAGMFTFSSEVEASRERKKMEVHISYQLLVFLYQLEDGKGDGLA